LWVVTTVLRSRPGRADDICALAGQCHHEAAVMQLQHRASGRTERYGVLGG